MRSVEQLFTAFLVPCGCCGPNEMHVPPRKFTVSFGILECPTPGDALPLRIRKWLFLSVHWPSFTYCHFYLCIQVMSKEKLFQVSIATCYILTEWNFNSCTSGGVGSFPKSLAGSFCYSHPLKGCNLFSKSWFPISVHILLNLMLYDLILGTLWKDVSHILKTKK